MKFAVIEITVKDMDLATIADEYAELQEIDDLPDNDAAMTYFTHRGHRVFLDLLDEHGQAASVDVSPESLAALRFVETEVNTAIVAAGADTAEIGWWFSSYAYCECPCSPGFLVTGTGTAKDVRLTLRVTELATAAA